MSRLALSIFLAPTVLGAALATADEGASAPVIRAAAQIEFAEPPALNPWAPCNAACAPSGACQPACDPCVPACPTADCFPPLRPCHAPGNLHPHTPYVAHPKLYYYFRPYQWRHVLEQQESVMSYGGDPRHPYANTEFLGIYEGLEEETLAE
jgi:hypothetical protein